MIKYSLKCAEGHHFDSWFQSAEAFDKLHGSANMSCPTCGNTDISKALMAPRVAPRARTADDAAPPPGGPTPGQGPNARPGAPGRNMHALTAPASPAEAALIELKEKIEAHSEYVGEDFAREARAIHDGAAPERSIYGETRGEDARKLIEDGIPVAPLPFLPSRKAN